MAFGDGLSSDLMHVARRLARKGFVVAGRIIFSCCLQFYGFTGCGYTREAKWSGDDCCAREGAE